MIEVYPETWPCSILVICESFGVVCSSKGAEFVRRGNDCISHCSKYDSLKMVEPLNVTSFRNVKALSHCNKVKSSIHFFHLSDSLVCEISSCFPQWSRLHLNYLIVCRSFRFS